MIGPSSHILIFSFTFTINSKSKYFYESPRSPFRFFRPDKRKALLLHKTEKKRRRKKKKKKKEEEESERPLATGARRLQQVNRERWGKGLGRPKRRSKAKRHEHESREVGPKVRLEPRARSSRDTKKNGMLEVWRLLLPVGWLGPKPASHTRKRKKERKKDFS